MGTEYRCQNAVAVARKPMYFNVRAPTTSVCELYTIYLMLNSQRDDFAYSALIQFGDNIEYLVLPCRV